jgi:uncharacterized protein DUF3300
MRIRLIRVLAGIVGVACVYPLTTAAQPAPPASGNPTLTAEQLDRLVAPVALYPDPLLSQVLMASTYPLEIVKADRWLKNPDNAALKGDDLSAAVQQQPWDPSVKSLAAFPQLLQMMDEHLDWTEQLGNAFVAQQADVMDAVQRLRQSAQTRGWLTSTPQQTVSNEGPTVIIQPASSELVYVPVYNPQCIYGSGDCPPAEAALTFGEGIYSPFAFWAWGILDFRDHHIRIDHDRFRRFHASHEPSEGIWRHDPANRLSIAHHIAETPAGLPGANAVLPRVLRGFAAPAVASAIHPSAPTVLHGIPGTANRMGLAQSAVGSLPRWRQVGNAFRPAPGRGRPAIPMMRWSAPTRGHR